jgi:hypothetical protein
MRGVYRLRTPRSRYTSIWNVTPVLDWLKEVDNLTCDLKELGFKTLMLIALATAQRMQTLAALDLEFMTKQSNCTTFHINELIKTSKPGKKIAINVCGFREDHDICPLLALAVYISRTAKFRNEGCSKLFVSFQKPHREVTTQPLSRWIRQVLTVVGIDKLFGAHSVRHAASSTAFFESTNIDSILSTVGWAKESTFARFYRHDIDKPSPTVEAAEAFSKAVLKKAV